MNNLDWCIYTYKHRRAFEYCVKKHIQDPELRAEMLRRAKLHDMDKMLMYQYRTQKEAQFLHMESQPHHLENDLERSYADYVEAVIDYEAAPYTKPDKPMNAYQLVSLLVEWNAIDADLSSTLLGIMRELGIDNADTYLNDSEGRAYFSNLGEITEEMIQAEIQVYLAERDK